MHIGHYNYLCIVCRATDFLFCFRSENSNIQTVIKALDSISNQFGLTDEIRCDNAGAFGDTYKLGEFFWQNNQQ